MIDVVKIMVEAAYPLEVILMCGIPKLKKSLHYMVFISM